MRDSIPEGRERRLESFADVLVGRGAPEIFVAVRSEGFGTIVSSPLSVVSLIARRLRAGERRFAPVGLARAELGQRGVEAAQVVLPHRRSDVDTEGDFVGAMRDDAGECSDDDVGDAVTVERGQEAARVEGGRPLGTARRRMAGPVEETVDAPLGESRRPSSRRSFLLVSRGTSTSGSSKSQACTTAIRLSMLGETAPCSQRAITERSRRCDRRAAAA